MKKKILLLMVQTEDMILNNEEPGICCIASYLRMHGYEVKLMSELKNKIDFEAIRRYRPDLVGLPVYKISETAALNAGETIKTLLPETRVCLGGYLPSYEYSALMARYDFVDYIIRGEGEIPFLNLIQSLEENRDLASVEGLIYRRNGDICINDMPGVRVPLNDLPWMARDLLKENKYKMALISGSRGCTGNCSFCVTGSHYKKWRGRTVADIVDELEYVQKTYDIHVFYFIDCSFENPGNSYDRVAKLAEEIRRRGLKIHYFAFFRADFQRNATPELMNLLRESGLFCSILGIEAANEACLKLYRKSATLSDNEKAIKLFRKNGIFVEMGFIMFNPYSTFERLRMNVDFLEKHRVACYLDYLLSRYSMYKGCALNQKIIADGLAFGDDEIYQYDYRDKRIQAMASYAVNFFYRIYRETGLKATQIHDTIISYEYIKIMHRDDLQLCRLLEERKPVSDKMADEANRRFADWFRALLKLAESNWNSIEADRIGERLIPRNYLIDFFTEMESRKKIFYLKLHRAGITLKKNPYIESI